MGDKTFPTPAAFAEKPRPPIQLHPVSSNQVGAIGYEPSTKTLAVQFRRGMRAIYHYPNVDPATYAAFRGAESIGTYFGQHLKSLPFEKFPCEDEAA